MAAAQRIRFAGLGGQGLVLSSIILAEAAGVYGGKRVVQSQQYGGAIRDTPSQGTVLISEGSVEYPWVTELDVLVALAQSALEAHLPLLRPGGLLIIDPMFVTKVSRTDVELHEIPATAMAEKLGNRRVANIIMLGSLTRLSGIVPYEAMEKAVLARAPKAWIDLNRTALKAGSEMEVQPAAV